MIERKEEKYVFVCSDETFERVKRYRQALLYGEEVAGQFLVNVLASKAPLVSLTDEAFFECLVQTKPDCIFAEKTRFDPSINWSSTELSLLGDVSCVISTKAYDNGAWSNPVIYDEPIDVTLAYVPGPLLRCVPNSEQPDLDEVCPGNVFNAEKYYRMIERRLLPVLLHRNSIAVAAWKDLLVTMPGVGCGQFSGLHAEIIHGELENAVARLLTEHGSKLTQIKAIWYDNHNKEQRTYSQINGINFLVRPLTESGLPQLCKPAEYGEDYANCELVSIVAWDHVSKPGNDYWKRSRLTDDGVKAAATDTMPALTGFEGEYFRAIPGVVPKEAPQLSWSQYIAKKGGITLKLAGNFYHYPTKNEAPNRVEQEERFAEERFAEQAERLAEQEKKLEEQEDRLTKQAEKLAEQAERLAEQAEKLEELEQEKNELNSRVEEQQENINVNRFFPSPASITTQRRGSQPDFLNLTQYSAIVDQINALTSEYESCWPYPNKPLKIKKIAVLNRLLEYTNEMEASAAIEKLKTEDMHLYRSAVSGSFSTRTHDLLRDLENGPIELRTSI